jgi:hypothetical protein
MPSWPLLVQWWHWKRKATEHFVLTLDAFLVDLGITSVLY